MIISVKNLREEKSKISPKETVQQQSLRAQNYRHRKRLGRQRQLVRRVRNSHSVNQKTLPNQQKLKAIKQEVIINYQPAKAQAT